MRKVSVWLKQDNNTSAASANQCCRHHGVALTRSESQVIPLLQQQYHGNVVKTNMFPIRSRSLPLPWWVHPRPLGHA